MKKVDRGLMGEGGIGRGIGGFVAVIMFLVSVFALWAGATGDTIPELSPLVAAVIGAGLLAGSLLIFNNIGIEDTKRLLKEQNDMLFELNRSINHNTTTNIEIARRQYQVEKRQTGTLMDRDRPQQPPN